MTVTKFFQFGALLAALCLLPYAASAAPFMNISFDGDTIGNQPATTYPAVTYPITQPWAIGGYTATTADSPPTPASGAIIVGNSGGMTQGIQMVSNSSNGVTGALWLDTAFNAIGQELRMSFDVNMLNAPTTATVQPKILDAGPATAGIVLGMNTYTTGGWAFRFAAAPTSASGGVFAIRSPDNLSLQSFFDYVEGQTYNVELIADYDTGKVDAFVDGVLKGNDLPFWNAGVPNVTTQEFFFHLNGESGNFNSVAIDNIVAAVVPEPASLAMAGFAAVGLIAVRRRRV